MNDDVEKLRARVAVLASELRETRRETAAWRAVLAKSAQVLGNFSKTMTRAVETRSSRRAAEKPVPSGSS